VSFDDFIEPSGLFITIDYKIKRPVIFWGAECGAGGELIV
jgi:hypothetical protein